MRVDISVRWNNNPESQILGFDVPAQIVETANAIARALRRYGRNDEAAKLIGDLQQAHAVGVPGDNPTQIPPEWSDPGDRPINEPESWRQRETSINEPTEWSQHGERTLNDPNKT
jgi:hypothetical protein